MEAPAPGPRRTGHGDQGKVTPQSREPAPFFDVQETAPARAVGLSPA